MNLPFNLTERGDHSLQFWSAKQCLVPSHSADWRVKKQSYQASSIMSEARRIKNKKEMQCFYTAKS